MKENRIGLQHILLIKHFPRVQGGSYIILVHTYIELFYMSAIKFVTDGMAISYRK
jgi:hypothetical protein